MERCPHCGQILPLSKEAVAEVQALLEEGFSVTAIAKEVGRSRVTIYRIKKRMELTNSSSSNKRLVVTTGKRPS
jgi:IS30 family transposase